MLRRTEGEQLEKQMENVKEKLKNYQNIEEKYLQENAENEENPIKILT